MNRIALNLVFAAATCAATAPLHAQNDALATWVGQVDKQITQVIQPPLSDVSGTATVSFRRGADGRAVDIVSKGSVGPVTQAALHTARRLHDLPPLPAGFSSDQRVTMNILVGDEANFRAYEAKRKLMFAAAGKANEQLAMRSTGTQVAMVRIP